MVVYKNDPSLMKDKKWGKVLLELFSVKTQFKMLQNKLFFLKKGLFRILRESFPLGITANFRFLY